MCKDWTNVKHYFNPFCTENLLLFLDNHIPHFFLLVTELPSISIVGSPGKRPHLPAMGGHASIFPWDMVRMMCVTSLKGSGLPSTLCSLRLQSGCGPSPHKQDPRQQWSTEGDRAACVALHGSLTSWGFYF